MATILIHVEEEAGNSGYSGLCLATVPVDPVGDVGELDPAKLQMVPADGTQRPLCSGDLLENLLGTDVGKCADAIEVFMLAAQSAYYNSPCVCVNFVSVFVLVSIPMCFVCKGILCCVHMLVSVDMNDMTPYV